MHAHTHTYTDTVEYYSSIKTEMLLFTITWINLEGIMLSERSQTEKDEYYSVLLLKCGM